MKEMGKNRGESLRKREVLTRTGIKEEGIEFPFSFQNIFPYKKGKAQEKTGVSK